MKSLWRSKTFWFNSVTCLGLSLEALVSNLGLIQPLVPAKAYPIVVSLMGIGNIILRVITSQAIGKEKQ